MNGQLFQQQIGITVFLSALLVITLSNLLYFKRLKERGPVPGPPRVSVLIPARNEEQNIKACIESLLLTDYTNIEVLVLDDNSEDSTGENVREISIRDDRVILIEGKPLPEGWLGKTWACHQLAQKATGDNLLFTDADTHHEPNTINSAISRMDYDGIDFLTLFPKEEVVSWAEKLTLPIMSLSFLSIMPLALAYRLRFPGLSAANGQFMMFRREAYELIGGHEAIKGEVLDDFRLAGRTKQMGLRWRFLDGSNSLSCRMYRNFSEVFEGFGKNLFSVFGCHSAIFLFIWFWMGVVFLSPPVIAALGLFDVILYDRLTWLCVANTGLGFTVWSISMARFEFPFYLVFFYPLIIIMSICLALYSFSLAVSGAARWKGRTLIRPKIHWI